ncbi:hypothetical protein AYO21_03298 [Fonsecaea monophora]|uniref:Uncharacterized protein n=1 Tax=Fonsecaea monophora TaxID=254056 RepID=A0A177FG34_9EURO|nr:hypothetical protein AYO21_03298 [Fonsecaea monophora]KAH0842988.1 hypothetical protein FOPE_08355 [Fonsecaea pedrosoi]OAG42422.1 hypothetical protein AYO21_03298 [Fonsecaea monophora]
MAPTIYQHAQTNDRTIYVPMNRVDIAFWSRTDYLYTDSLNGCTAVIIISPHAGILAHIAPRPSGAELNRVNAEDGDRNLREKMQQVIDLYNANRYYFQDARTRVVVAVYRYSIALPTTVNTIDAILNHLRLPIRTNHYDVLEPNSQRPFGHTYIVIASRGSGYWPTLYVNERMVECL